MTTLICQACDEVVEDKPTGLTSTARVTATTASRTVANDGSGTKYCCGAIYEDGETTCRSCGDPL